MTLLVPRKARDEPEIHTGDEKIGLMVLGVLGLIILAGIGWAIGINNQLATQEHVVNEKWAQVQNVYSRRADLVPRLVEVVKGAAPHERTLLEQVTKARVSVAGIRATPELIDDPEASRKFQQAQQELGAALGRLLVIVERYPDLKSNENFLALQGQLDEAENRIAVARMRYNESVRDYDARLKLFPGSLVASFRGFKGKAIFEAAARQERPR